MKAQPAKINYFFKDVYSETWDVIKNAFAQWIGRIKKYWWRLSQDSGPALKSTMGAVFHLNRPISNFFVSIWNAILFGWDLAVFLANLIFSPVLCIFFSAYNIVAMALLMLGIMATFGVVSLIDWIYRKAKRLSNGCPSCQAKFDLPTYVCPQCGALHTKLTPSKYGIFNRVCECGHKIPTTFLNGRQSISGICPDCGKPLTNAGAHTEVWIPVLGGPSVGKTCFITMAISEIEKKANEGGSVEFKYVKNIHEDREDMFETYRKMLGNGNRPPKTDATNTRMMFYQFNLDPKGSNTGNFISLCDMPGEVFNADNKTSFAQEGLGVIDGVILLIDPLSIPAFRDEFVAKNEGVDVYQYAASDFEINDVATTFIDALENMLGKKGGEFKKPAAIVFTKMDIPELEDMIGEKAIDKYLSRFADDDKNKPSREDALNAVCEEFLVRYDVPEFVQTLHLKFKDLRFFTCAPLGHNEDGNPFVPLRVEDSIQWIIEKKCPTLKNGLDAKVSEAKIEAANKKKAKWAKQAAETFEKPQAAKKTKGQSDEDIITLTAASGNEIDFRSVAVIAYKGKLYSILQPVELLDGMDADEALVFEITTDDNGNNSFQVVLDDDVINGVFENYQNL